MNRDPHLAPGHGRVRGAGDQAAGPHAGRRTAASAASTLDYDALRGIDDVTARLF